MVLVCALVVSGLVAGCADNPANVRVLASAIRTVSNDAPEVVAGDQALCEQNALLQKEYKKIEHQSLPPPPCTDLAGVLTAILVENKALKAYGQALSNIAQNQFVTVDTDAKSVTTSLQRANVVPAPVVAAVGSVFSLVETAALKGYRQKELSKALTGKPAVAVQTVMASYAQLATQYSRALVSYRENIDLVKNAIAHCPKHKKTITPCHTQQEPVAVTELWFRLTALQDSAASKSDAIKAFSMAVDKVKPAFNAAAQDLTNPNPKEIYQAVKIFATQVKDANDKLKKAFGTP